MLRHRLRRDLRQLKEVFGQAEARVEEARAAVRGQLSVLCSATDRGTVPGAGAIAVTATYAGGKELWRKREILRSGGGEMEAVVAALEQLRDRGVRQSAAVFATGTRTAALAAGTTTPTGGQTKVVRRVRDLTERMKRSGCTVRFLHVERSEGRVEELLQWASEMEVPAKQQTHGGQRTLEEVLAEWGLIPKDVGGAGDCQFRVVSAGLFGSAAHHLRVRGMAVEVLRSRGKEIADFLVDVRPEEYLRAMEAPGAWGDHLTLQALAEATGRRMCVLDTGPEGLRVTVLRGWSDSRSDGEDEPFALKEDDVCLGYTGSHYLLVKTEGEKKRVEATCSKPLLKIGRPWAEKGLKQPKTSAALQDGLSLLQGEWGVPVVEAAAYSGGAAVCLWRGTAVQGASFLRQNPETALVSAGPIPASHTEERRATVLGGKGAEKRSLWVAANCSLRRLEVRREKEIEDVGAEPAEPPVPLFYETVIGEGEGVKRAKQRLARTMQRPAKTMRAIGSPPDAIQAVAEVRRQDVVRLLRCSGDERVFVRTSLADRSFQVMWVGSEEAARDAREKMGRAGILAAGLARRRDGEFGVRVPFELYGGAVESIGRTRAFAVAGVPATLGARDVELSLDEAGWKGVRAARADPPRRGLTRWHVEAGTAPGCPVVEIGRSTWQVLEEASRPPRSAEKVGVNRMDTEEEFPPLARQTRRNQEPPPSQPREGPQQPETPFVKKTVWGNTGAQGKEREKVAGVETAWTNPQRLEGSLAPRGAWGLEEKLREERRVFLEQTRNLVKETVRALLEEWRPELQCQRQHQREEMEVDEEPPAGRAPPVDLQEELVELRRRVEEQASMQKGWEEANGRLRRDNTNLQAENQRLARCMDELSTRVQSLTQQQERAAEQSEEDRKRLEIAEAQRKTIESMRAEGERLKQANSELTGLVETGRAEAEQKESHRREEVEKLREQVLALSGQLAESQQQQEQLRQQISLQQQPRPSTQQHTPQEEQEEGIRRFLSGGRGRSKLTTKSETTGKGKGGKTDPDVSSRASPYEAKRK